MEENYIIGEHCITMPAKLSVLDRKKRKRRQIGKQTTRNVDTEKKLLSV
jgi:hypothetical protein